MDEEEIERGIIKKVDATSVLVLLAGISAGWITFVNTFKHEHLHIPSFQFGQGSLCIAFPGLSFTPEARHTWLAFLALKTGETHFLSTCNWRTVREFDRRAAADKAITYKLDHSTVRLRQ